jgi:hypothetical protein
VVAGSSLPALLDAAERELIERVDGGMQMTLGEMQIDGGIFEPFMAHQQLDGAQVGTALQQMRGEAVATGIVVLLMICIPQKFAIPYIHTSELK